MEGNKIAWIAGATGLVGKALLSELLASERYGSVIALVRRSTGQKHPKLLERIVEFGRLDVAGLPSPDDVFCALGTTIKKAGSQLRFREVDFQYAINFAEAAKAAGAQEFLLVSSVGASSNSHNFYLRTKGELESALEDMRFPTLHIFRPSVLVGHREEERTTERLGVVLGRLIAPLMISRLRKYRPVESSAVARAMIAAAEQSTAGVAVHGFDSIHELADH